MCQCIFRGLIGQFYSGVILHCSSVFFDTGFYFFNFGIFNHEGPGKHFSLRTQSLIGFLVTDVRFNNRTANLERFRGEKFHCLWICSMDNYLNLLDIATGRPFGYIT
jgi:hypothetical protein